MPRWAWRAVWTLFALKAAGDIAEVIL